jgi:three-Cys-motif partner protein
MPSNCNFFASPQAAAIYKHGVLRRYIPVYAGKTGSRSAGKRVVIYDAYSGPGRYDDDQPASPELVVDTAIAMAKLRDIYSIFSDVDPGYIARLQALMQKKGVDPTTYEIQQSPVEEHLDSVLAFTGRSPLFVFLDPFGLALPFDRVVDLLTCRDRAGWSNTLQPKTELLMNFSYEAVRRIAGAFLSTKSYSARAAQIAALDDALGGDWWQEIVRADKDDWPEQVLEGFADRVMKEAGYSYITADVRDSLSTKPVYELILFTRHQDGVWKMLDAMSLAREDWRNWLKRASKAAKAGQYDLGFAATFDEDEDAWIAEIAANTKKLLAAQPGFVVMNVLSPLFGRTIGLAREKHLRAALKGLHNAGVIRDAPKGSLQKARVRRV